MIIVPLSKHVTGSLISIDDMDYKLKGKFTIILRPRNKKVKGIKSEVGC